jgi:uncharacterized BrkB/YihY/UPF0761 family membrane protein
VNRPWVQVLMWGTYLAVLTIILWIWWPHWLSVLQLGLAAIVVALIAVGFTLFHRRRAYSREVRRLSDISPGTVLVAIGLAGMLYGAEFGLFLVLIGGGIAVAGVAQLVVERRSRA